MRLLYLFVFFNVGIVPTYLWIRKIGLLNNRLVLIVPLSKPIIATIVLWAAVAHWNAWFDSLIYINDSSKEVLQMSLRRIMFLVHSSEMIDNTKRFEILHQGHIHRIVEGVDVREKTAWPLCLS